jgi:hypothetical protein
LSDEALIICDSVVAWARAPLAVFMTLSALEQAVSAAADLPAEASIANFRIDKSLEAASNNA